MIVETAQLSYYYANQQDYFRSILKMNLLHYKKKPSIFPLKFVILMWIITTSNLKTNYEGINQ